MQQSSARSRDRGVKRPLATFSELAAAAAAQPYPATRRRRVQASAALVAAQREGVEAASATWGSAWPAHPDTPATVTALQMIRAPLIWSSRTRHGSPASTSSSSAPSEECWENRDTHARVQAAPGAPLQLGGAQQRLLRKMRGPRSRRTHASCAATPGPPADAPAPATAKAAGPDASSPCDVTPTPRGTTSLCWEPMGFEDGDGEPVVTENDEAALGDPIDLF